MKKVLEKIKNLKLDTKILTMAFVAIGLITIFFEFQKKSDSKVQEAHESSASVDTFIPRGYVLVPLEIVNAESLNSLIGDVGGVVDLYLAKADDQKVRTSKKVASKVKIVRAPLNPQQFAVLVKDGDSTGLLGLPGPFFAVVQNPKSTGSEINKTSHSSIHVDYQK